MTHTTIEIDDPTLNEIRAIQKKEGQSIGKIVSQLHAEALIKQKTSAKTPGFRRISRPMRARVDLADKEKVYRILDWDPK